MLEQAKQEIREQAAESIAIGLTQGSLKTWKWLAIQVDYRLGEKAEQMDNVFDIRVAIANHSLQQQLYSDSLAKTTRLINKALLRCGLQEIEQPGEEQTAPVPAGTLLVEVFADGEFQERSLSEVFPKAESEAPGAIR